MAQELNNAGNGLKWNNVNINYYSFDFYKSILNKFASVKDRGCISSAGRGKFLSQRGAFFQ